jgi:uncharacterized protein YlxW (UPF0749 family)
MTVTIGIVCFILAYVMFMQFKTVDETNITQIENMRESELRESLATWKEKYEETESKLEETKTKLQEYRQKRADNLETTELLEQELLQAKTIAGLTDVKGNGVVVTFYDDEESQIGQIDNYDLMELVNELKLAGAEAISINDQRIINMSDITSIDVDGTPFILIDTTRVTSPYIIKAIGDQTYLESALTTKTIGFVTRHQNATVEKQNNIVIYKYSGEIKLNYATDVVKEEN